MLGVTKHLPWLTSTAWKGEKTWPRNSHHSVKFFIWLLSLFSTHTLSFYFFDIFLFPFSSVEIVSLSFTVLRVGLSSRSTSGVMDVDPTWEWACATTPRRPELVAITPHPSSSSGWSATCVTTTLRYRLTLRSVWVHLIVYPPSLITAFSGTSD